MRVNRMCENFGAYYGTEPGSDGSTCSRYEILDGTEDGVPVTKIKCRYCGVGRVLHTARSIRPIADGCLSAGYTARPRAMAQEGNLHGD